MQNAVTSDSKQCRASFPNSVHRTESDLLEAYVPVDDVRDGLESYLETKARAEELEAKIEKTDESIDEIVYELYGLADEEIEIVEEAVAD